MRILLLLVMVLFTAPAFSNPDEGLYDPVAPEGSAFFRFIHADPSRSDATPIADTKSYDALSYKSISPYFVVAEGDVIFKAGDHQRAHALSAKRYYSVIIQNNGLNVLEDQALDNMSKAQITFYNMSTRPVLTLQTRGQKVIPITKDVQSGLSSSREINAVKLTPAISEFEQEVTYLEEIVLENKNSYSVIAFDTQDGEVEAIIQKARTDTTR